MKIPEIWQVGLTVTLAVLGGCYTMLTIMISPIRDDVSYLRGRTDLIAESLGDLATNREVIRTEVDRVIQRIDLAEQNLTSASSDMAELRERLASIEAVIKTSASRQSAFESYAISFTKGAPFLPPEWKTQNDIILQDLLLDGQNPLKRWYDLAAPK